MASFGGDLDLLSMIGAQLIAVKNEKGNDVQGVFIPISYNQMRVFQDNKGKAHATFRFNMWPASNGIVEYWKKQRLTSGEQITAYNVPTHRIELNLTDEYKQKLLARAKQLSLEQHKDDWKTPEQQDEKQNRDLRNLMYSFMPSDLCSSVWMHQPKNQPGGSAAPQPAPQTVQATATAWRPNFGADGSIVGGTDIPEDSNLPF